jgi:TonB family protein
VFEAVLHDDDERERAFRRALALSVGAHLVLLGLAYVNPFHSRSYELPAGVMDVSLVAAVPSAQAAAPRAAPRPAPPKPAAKPKPPPKEVAKPVPPPEAPQVKADKKLLPKEAVQEPKPKPKPTPAVKPPEKELDYDDALDSLREELGEPEDEGEAPDPELLASVKPARGPAGMGGTGDPLDPLIAAWIKRVKIHVSRAWVLEPSFKRQIIEAEIVVTLDASGRVLAVDVQRRSGNPYYDESVVRAIEKASPLPAPPEDGDWAFVFTPQDVL